MTVMRAKMVIVNIETSEKCETLTLNAVCKAGSYPADGSDEDNSFARWTPSASLKMSITNPDLIGKFALGEKYYLDFTKAE